MKTRKHLRDSYGESFQLVQAEPGPTAKKYTCICSRSPSPYETVWEIRVSSVASQETAAAMPEKQEVRNNRRHDEGGPHTTTSWLRTNSTTANKQNQSLFHETDCVQRCHRDSNKNTNRKAEFGGGEVSCQ